jgi:hypothetical protein
VAFLFTAFFLFIYDRMVHRRQEKTMQSAIQTGRVVSSLFPKSVRARVLEGVDAGGDEKNLAKRKNWFKEEDDEKVEGVFKTRPIADFFPYVTIMFADIAGFTAWSSAREPFQVFLLLETLYGAFDAIAKKRRVFKVETIGDCYVAVAGLPNPRKDHAVVMARFASDCLYRAQVITQKLEIELGPDTADLCFRVGESLSFRA